MASYTYTQGGPYTSGGNFLHTNANNMEAGIANAATYKLDRDGSIANTGTQDFNRTLSGADKTFLTLTATDGKQYALIERNADKTLIIRNVTDSITLLELGPTLALTKIAGGAPVLRASGGGFANYDIGVGPSGSRPAAGSKGRVYIETPFS